jgi:hypothetical protein
VRIISDESNWRASLGLAFRIKTAYVPDPLDEPAGTKKATNYNLARVISGFGIIRQNETKMPTVN